MNAIKRLRQLSDKSCRVTLITQQLLPSAMPMRLHSYRGAITDVFCVLLLGLVVLLIYLFVPPFHRGFFCDDDSIRYPVPITQTISDATVIVVSLSIPFLVVIVVEIVQNGLTTPSNLVVFGWTPYEWMMKSYARIGVFLFGAGALETIVETGKRMIGRLRPHFFYACLPMGLDCDNTTGHKYIDVYTCSGNADVVHEARMSFPSGHSSLSFYAATFIVLYLHNQLTCDFSKLLKHLLQFLAISAAWATALTRVSDFMHHWSDVLSGIVIGTLTGILTVIFASNLGRRRRNYDSTEMISLMKKPNTGYNNTGNNTIPNNDV